MLVVRTLEIRKCPSERQSCPAAVGEVVESLASNCGAGTAQRTLPPLTQLFRTQYRQLLRFCRMRVRNPADAEDIVQSAFLSARQAYPDKGIEELRPLLLTLVRNKTLNFLKSADHKRQQASVDFEEAADRLACGRTPTPEQQVMDAERLALAETLIAGMPERRRQALLLHRIEGLTHAEIGERLSIARQTVIIDIAEAVAELAEGLARAEHRRTSSGD